MLYQNGAVAVDRDFARFGSKSYAIDKINTVDVRERRPHGMAPVLIFGFLALMFAWSGWAAIQVNGGGAFFMLAAGCAAVAWWANRRRAVIEYQLYLMTSSTEAQAIKTCDGEEIAALRHAIESAMSGLRQHDMNVRFVAPGPQTDAGETVDLRPSQSSVRRRLLGGGAG